MASRRFHAGLHISQNGQMLAGMLERLQLLWPVPIDELVLVGHSMGGLVARSAGYYGVQQHHWWTAAVGHVVCLGSPHLGAEGSMSRPGRWRGCPKPALWRAF